MQLYYRRMYMYLSLCLSSQVEVVHAALADAGRVPSDADCVFFSCGATQLKLYSMC